jgi:hypothetical protein
MSIAEGDQLANERSQDNRLRNGLRLRWTEATEEQRARADA